jgi:hypothetical protein
MNVKYIACLLVGLIAGIPTGLMIGSAPASATATQTVRDSIARIARQSRVLKLIESGKNTNAAQLINGEMDADIILVSTLMGGVPEGAEKERFAKVLRGVANDRAARPVERPKSPLDSLEDAGEHEEVRRRIDDFLKRYRDSEPALPGGRK